MSIKLQLNGFDDLFEQIKAAGGTVDQAANSCMKQSAQIMQNELKSQMQKSGVDSGLINRMPQPQLDVDGNVYIARVGYKKGAYTPGDLSDGYKVVFLNYGTPHRSKHGKIPEKGFIQRAKKKARPQIKKAQKATLEKILGRLKRK